MSRRTGFTLLEVMIALIMISLALTVLARATGQVTSAVAVGRRWTAMAAAAQVELVRLARDYQLAAPHCVSPGSGVRYTADGIRLDWTVVADSARMAVSLSVSATALRRRLADSLATSVRCQ